MTPLAPILAPAASVEDAAIGIAVMAASASPKDAPRYTPPSLWRCKAHAPLTGLRVGVYGAWTDSASPEVRSKAGRAMEALRELGAREVEIRIPGEMRGDGRQQVRVEQGCE